MSIEIDVIPIADSNEETARLADLIEGVAGEWSPFEQQHGFSIEGVDLSTVILAYGWRDRLVKVQNANTAAPVGEPRFTGWCLDKEDLCVAKLCAFREKDRNFVAALHEAQLVDGDVITTRLRSLPATHRVGRNGHSRGWLRQVGEGPHVEASRRDVSRAGAVTGCEGHST